MNLSKQRMGINRVQGSTGIQVSEWQMYRKRIGPGFFPRSALPCPALPALGPGMRPQLPTDCPARDVRSRPSDLCRATRPASLLSRCYCSGTTTTITKYQPTIPRAFLLRPLFLDPLTGTHPDVRYLLENKSIHEK